MRLETYSGDKPYIFISYAHKDSDEVLPIIDAMQKNGFRIWFDQGIEAGTEWPEFIAEHLDSAENVIVFMSNAAVESKNCRREINYAIDINKEPLVVYLEEVQLSSGLKLQLNTLQAMFKYRAKTDGDFITEICKAKMLQCCRESENVAETVTAEPIATPEPTPTSVVETPAQTPSAAPPTITPIPAPMPPIGYRPDRPTKPSIRSFRLPIIIVAAVIVLTVIIGVVVGVSSGGNGTSNEMRSKTLLLPDDDGEGYSIQVDLHYRKSDDIVCGFEMTVLLDISDYEFGDSELRDYIEEIKTDSKEEVKDLAFASTDVTVKNNVMYIEYSFSQLDNNDNAKQLIEEYLETQDYSPNYADGDYRLYYLTMCDEMLNREGFVYQ